MPLPKISQPLFELTIPSTKQKVKYRPFTVKEEKILLIARESAELDQIFLAIKQVVNNCLQSDKIDVDKLATFDLEYILVNIRAKAVNDVVSFQVPDPDNEGKKLDLSFNVKDVSIARLKEADAKIDASNDFFIFMRYPTLSELTLLSQEGTVSDISFKVMISCIDKVVSKDGEKVYNMSDFSEEEISDFIDDLSSNAITKIQEFFTKMPALRIECPYMNSKGEQKKFVIEGIQSFFM